jgi:beta-lactam-binding protein with PASTA domain
MRITLERLTVPALSAIRIVLILAASATVATTARSQLRDAATIRVRSETLAQMRARERAQTAVDSQRILGHRDLGLSSAQAPRMPQLRGLTAQAARDTLARRWHLAIRVQDVRDTSDSASDGLVIDQSPPADSTITPNTVVRIVVAHYVPPPPPPPPIDSVSVPDLGKLAYREVAESLAANDLTLALEVSLSASERDRAIANFQSIAPFTRVPRNSLVRVRFFVPPAPDTLVTVPSFLGVDVTDAVRRADSLTLRAVVRVDTTTAGSNGKISDSDPGAGSRVPRGSSIVLTVAVPHPDRSLWPFAALGVVALISILVWRWYDKRPPPRLPPPQLPVVVSPTISVLQPATPPSASIPTRDGESIVTQDIEVAIVADAPQTAVTISAGSTLIHAGAAS